LSEVRFYWDENVPTAVAEQLVRQGIDAVSVKNLRHLGDSDINHLRRATEMGRMLCTYDADFLQINAQEVNHAGIAFAQQFQTTIGSWVKALRALHARMSAEDAIGQVVYLSLK
jgi:hypothetical protein